MRNHRHRPSVRLRRGHRRASPLHIERLELRRLLAVVADAGGPYSMVEGDGLALDASASYDPDGGAIASYRWDVNGDGNFGDATGATPLLSWMQLQALGVNDGPALHAVRVEVVDADQETSISTPVAVNVDDKPPWIKLSGRPNATEGVNYSLGLGTIVDPGADTVVEWQVEWGDGSRPAILSAGGTVRHTYLDGPGSAVITVSLRDEEGLHLNSSALSIDVLNVPPEVSITGAPTNYVEGAPIALAADIFDPAGKNDDYTYAWTFTKDGAPWGAPSSLRDPAILPTDEGVYGVHVVVSDGDATDEDSTTIVIGNVRPSLDSLSVTPEVIEGGALQISGTYSDPGSTDTHELDVDWDGDGDFDETFAVSGGAFAVSRTLADDAPSGTFNVHVRVRDDDTSFMLDLGTPRTSPDPHPEDHFGSSLVANGGTLLVGNRNSDVGAGNSGSVYFLSADGTQATLVNNPSPGVQDAFGNSAYLGPEGAMVGGWSDDEYGEDTGIAYAYDRQGNYRLTLTNPAPDPDDRFGWGLSMVNGDYLVTAYKDSTFAPVGGAAYLFDGETGALRYTFSDPTPHELDRFGYSAASWGRYAIVGCYRESEILPNCGAVYIFDTLDGSLVRTLYNPLPGSHDLFGKAMAVSGDRLAVAAPEDDSFGVDAGAAFVFDLNTGDLLYGVGSPNPQSGGEFGWHLAWLDDKLVVGAPSEEDLGLLNCGNAYLFDDEGELISVLPNPNPSANDYYGSGVAGMDGKIYVATPFEDLVGEDTGVVYEIDWEPNMGSAVALVHNAPPTVDAGPDASIRLGEPLVRAGSFTDPGADTWTATVDYGDGAGLQPLALDGMTFTLQTTYATSGTKTITVTVTDDDGGQHSDSLLVHVEARRTTVGSLKLLASADTSGDESIEAGGAIRRTTGEFWKPTESALAPPSRHIRVDVSPLRAFARRGDEQTIDDRLLLPPVDARRAELVDAVVPLIDDWLETNPGLPS